MDYERAQHDFGMLVEELHVDTYQAKLFYYESQLYLAKDNAKFIG